MKFSVKCVDKYLSYQLIETSRPYATRGQTSVSSYSKQASFEPKHVVFILSVNAMTDSINIISEGYFN